MAKLSTAKRAALPANDFGIPSTRSYPMPDKSHAANAKARATQQVAAGNLAPATASKIKAKANRVLGSTPKLANGGMVPGKRLKGGSC